jgi:hypothetical protein
MLSIFLTGSRGGIVIFFGLFIYSSIVLFNFNKIIISFLIALLGLIVFYNNSSVTMKNRYNVVKIFDDQSYLLRLKYLKESLNIQDNKMTSTAQDNKIIVALFGMKLVQPDQVKIIEYNHNILELIRNNGVIFIFSLMSLFIYLLVSLKDFKLLFLIFIPIIISFTLLSDIIVFLWAVIGIIALPNNRKPTNF